MLMIVMILTLRKYCEEQRMYLVYIYNSFILNVFLTFSTFLTFIYVVTRFKLVAIWVGGSRSCTCQERHAKDMLILTCWRAKYGKTVRRIFTSWFGTYCIYICFFLIWCKYQKAFCKIHYHVLFFCLAAVVVQVNTANNIQYLWLFLDIHIKYSAKSIIFS